MKSSHLFKPPIDRLKLVLRQQSVIHADEAPLKVIKEDKKNCYMRVYCTGTDSPNESRLPNIILYDYQNSRAGSCPVNYLGYFNGYLLVDGYASAVQYSIIVTAKANGLIPFDYLMHCFEHLANGSDCIEAILPWNINLS